MVPVRESSVTVPWRTVEWVIGVNAECVQQAAFKHTFSEAAMLNIHLWQGLNWDLLCGGLSTLKKKPLNGTFWRVLCKESKSCMICALQSIGS